MLQVLLVRFALELSFAQNGLVVDPQLSVEAVTADRFCLDYELVVRMQNFSSAEVTCPANIPWNFCAFFHWDI